MGATVAPVVRRPNPTAVGIAIWLASEVMFFGGLFAAYFAIRAANDDWPPHGIHLDTVRAGLFTLVLVASSFTLHAAERGSHPGARNWTLATLGLGVIFLANQAAEWAGNDFSVSTNAYGSMYYALTGFHGLHVAVGLVLLAIVGLRDPDAPSSVPGLRQATTWYWHFVDVVWVGLFTTIFLIR
jgi:cytochrome c oxidase subunit 3